MKLRTKLTASRDGSLVDATDENLIHDAACAHALMMAIKDGSEAAGFDVGWWITARADSILKQWGFDSGEQLE